MRAGKDTDRSVVDPAIVDVDADSDHPLEHWNGRLHMLNSAFHTPGTEASDLASSPNGNCEVLVPGDLPVRPGRLVEKKSANGETARAQNASRRGSYRRMSCQRTDLRHALQQAANAATPIPQGAVAKIR